MVTKKRKKKDEYVEYKKTQELFSANTTAAKEMIDELSSDNDSEPDIGASSAAKETTETMEDEKELMIDELSSGGDVEDKKEPMIDKISSDDNSEPDVGASSAPEETTETMEGKKEPKKKGRLKKEECVEALAKNTQQNQYQRKSTFNH